MNVFIDGVQYAPVAPVCDNPAPLDARAFIADIGRDVSLREYLHELLYTLWNEGEGFSGKRPFGNSGWEYDVYKLLIVSGAIKGELNEEGYVEEADCDSANAIMPGLIAAALGIDGTPP